MATVRAIPLDRPDPEASVLERAVCLTLSMGRFGNTRKVATALINVDADKARLAVSKRLLDSPELEAVQRFDKQLRDWIEAEALPLPMFRGSYVVPIPSVEKVDQHLRDVIPQRTALIETACTAYPQRIRESTTALRVVFEPTNYPSVERFRGMFYLDWRWITIGTPNQLRQISATFFREEREKAAQYWTEAMEEGKQFLRGIFLELVKHARERLEPGPEGKPRIFRNSMVENISTFLDTFNARNIADDSQLAELVGQMRQLAAGVEPEDLRGDSGLRRAWARELGKIETTLNSMVIDKPTRRITFED